MNTRGKRLKTLLVLTVVVICYFFLPAAYAATITDVTPIDPITVPSGTSIEDALDALPDQTTIILDDSSTMPVDLTWALREKVITSRGGNEVFQVYYPTARGIYEMEGTFELPSGVQQSDPPTDLFVIAEVTIASGSLITVDDTDYFDQPGEYGRVTKTYGSIDRTYDYYVPSSYNGDPMPLVITLHGAGSYGAGQMFYSGFDDLGEQEGFIVVAPDYGLSAYGFFMFPRIKDFASDIIDDMAVIYNIDLRRVYASGISMGGSSSISLAYDIPDKIAAVAPMATGASSVLGDDLPKPTTFILFYGTRDSGWGADGSVLFAAVNKLVEENQGFPDPLITEWDSVVEEPNQTTITQFTYEGGVYGTEVIFYQVNEGGHTWPGKYQYASLITVGLTSQQFDATEAIWNHLKIHTLPMETSIDIKQESINPKQKGVIPVAILTTNNFDASTVEVETVQFGPAGARAEHSNVEDVNDDGYLDMMLNFRAQDTGIQAGDTSATLTGRSSVFGAFFGSDTFKTVPKPK
jgi:polyhydroxybutyrate depolymerase